MPVYAALPLEPSSGSRAYTQQQGKQQYDC